MALDKLTIHNFKGSGSRVASLPGFSCVTGINIEGFPRTVRLMLEGALRACIQGRLRFDEVIEMARWSPERRDLQFPIGRVVMQDAAGIPVLIDLAALRTAVTRLQHNPNNVRLAVPATLVVDHSVQVDEWRSPRSAEINLQLEISRNEERYSFIKWARQAFPGLEVIPPGNGIIHQLNIEKLSSLVVDREGWLFPDSVIGTDSHTTMINGLGILGWGVGGIEAEEALLGGLQVIPSPNIVNVRLLGRPRPGLCGSDLALNIIKYLRDVGVVGRYVEFSGPGVLHLSVDDRCTIANMVPEYGATTGLFPIDEQVINHFSAMGHDKASLHLARQYLEHQGLFGDEGNVFHQSTETLTLDLSTFERAVAGPSRPDQKMTLPDVNASFRTLACENSDQSVARGNFSTETDEVRDGDLALAALTSCANTGNLRAMIMAGLVARKALTHGLIVAPRTKCSLSLGSRKIAKSLEAADLLAPLEELGFRLVAFGCATCVGNSGDIDPVLTEAVSRGVKLAAVLSGNRNFEGRIHPKVAGNYLMSPPLVVAYGLAGTIMWNADSDILLPGPERQGVTLADLWPTEQEINEAMRDVIGIVGNEGLIEPEAWQNIPTPTGAVYPWSQASTYFREPPFFSVSEMPPGDAIIGAHPLLILGDDITTDHISPVGPIPPRSDAGRYLRRIGVSEENINTFAARRGNHEVMERGTFANPRLANRLVAGRQGPWTIQRPSGKIVSIYEAAERFRRENIPMIIVAGTRYGMGSARDWAAKGTYLLGVRAVVAKSFERIHRGNLLRLGVAPIECPDVDELADALCSNALMTVDIVGLEAGKIHAEVTIKAGETGLSFFGNLRVDTSNEVEILAVGGIYHRTFNHFIGTSRTGSLD